MNGVTASFSLRGSFGVGLHNGFCDVCSFRRGCGDFVVDRAAFHLRHFAFR